MKIHTLSCITEETLLLTHVRQSDVQVPGPGQVVSDEDQSSDESGAAPAQERVEDELEHGGAPPGNLTSENIDDDDDDCDYLGSDESPAEVYTHHSHPGEHGQGEVVAEIP